MTDRDRVALGGLIRSRRERDFGTKRAAYAAAEVNAATWDRAESGEPVRPDRLRRIVRLLWPETQGDWTLIDAAPSETSASRIEELEREISVLKAQLDLVARAASVPRDALENIHHRANREALEKARGEAADAGADEDGAGERDRPRVIGE